LIQKSETGSTASYLQVTQNEVLPYSHNRDILPTALKDSCTLQKNKRTLKVKSLSLFHKKEIPNILLSTLVRRYNTALSIINEQRRPMKQKSII
jgi:hypothetical protein